MARVSGDLIAGLLGSIDDMIGADSGVGWGKPLNGNRPDMQNLMAPQPVSDKTAESEHRYWVEKSADGETLGKPEPNDLPRIKLRLEKDFGKQKAAVMMKSIEEMSYAAYGK